MLSPCSLATILFLLFFRFASHPSLSVFCNFCTLWTLAPGSHFTSAQGARCSQRVPSNLIRILTSAGMYWLTRMSSFFFFYDLQKSESFAAHKNSPRKGKSFSFLYLLFVVVVRMFHTPYVYSPTLASYT